MAQSLLAHLSSQFRGKTEDVATLSLQYILSQSSELREAFTQKIASILSIPLNTLSYRCQVTGSDFERPDMAGYDASNQEQVLFEMKFYAGLTENQPLGYLDRIKKNGGKGLIFICPNARRTHLWAELKDLCAEREIASIHSFCIKVDGINLAIATWPDILDALNKAASANAPDSLADLKQLDGLCAQMDRDAFIPFVAEDLTADNAKKIDRFYQVVDETINLLQADENLKTSSKGLKSSHQWSYYSRSLYLDEFAINLLYNRYLWQKDSSIETPFWLGLWDKLDDPKNWDESPELTRKCENVSGGRSEGGWLALIPPTNATLDEVCQDLKRQILEYLDVFR